MATTTDVNIILKARDEATAKLRDLSGSMSGLMGSVSRLTGGFGGLSLAVAGVGLAVAGAAALVKFTNQVAEDVEQLDNLSASTGVSAQRLQVLQFAFKQGGVDAGALSQGLNFLNRAIANNDPALKKLGVTSTNTFFALQQAAAGLAKTTGSADRAKLAFEVFGRGGAQLLPILNQIAFNLDGVTESAIRTGNALSDEQLQTLRDVDAAMDQLNATVKGLGNQFAVTLAPAVTTLLKPIAELLAFLQKIDSAMHNIGVGIGDFAADVLGAPRRFDITKGFGSRDVEGVEVTAKRLSREELMKKQYEAALRAQRLFASGPGAFGFSILGTQDAGATPHALQTPMGEAFKIGPMLDEAKTHLTTFQEHMQEVAANIIQTFEIIGSALRNSIVSVFVNMAQAGQTLKSAMASIWLAIKQSILQAIGEIVAAQITQAFLKLLGIALSFVTGNPYAAIISGASPGGGTFGTPGGPLAPPPVPFAAGMVGGGGDTYVIQTISAKDMLSSMVAPTGALRSANSRLVERAAVS